MFSPLNDPSVDDWFQRFNAPLKRLPFQERAQLHTEVRQHLEALVAANEELGSTSKEAWAHALNQFGNPDQIGRRLAWEWRQGKGFVSPDMAAVLYGLAVHIVLTCLLLPTTSFATAALGHNDNMEAVVRWEYLIAVPLLTGAALGQRFPRQAITAAFYTTFAWPLLPMVAITALFVTHLRPTDLYAVRLWPAIWLTLGCGAAYLASVTRRGWYQPSLADFKLNLPQKKARA